MAKFMVHTKGKMNGTMPSEASHLNMVVVQVKDQDPIDMVELCTQLNAQFEYLHHELSG
jgi:hypothetical protein